MKTQSRPRQNGYDKTDIAEDVKEKNPCVLLLGISWHRKTSITNGACYFVGGNKDKNDLKVEEGFLWAGEESVLGDKGRRKFDGD